MSRLGENNTDLQGILQDINNLPPAGDAVLEPLSVTENGTYNPPTGVNGFKPVTVNVSGGAPLPVLTNPATAGDIADGKEAIDGNGDKLTGTNTFNADTSNDTAVESDVAQGKTFHKADGTQAVGTATGGGVLTDAIVITERNSDGRPTKIDFYNTDIFCQYQFGANVSSTAHAWGMLQSITFKSPTIVKNLSERMFYNNSQLSEFLPANVFDFAETIGASAFGNTAIVEAVFPNVTGTLVGCFTNCTQLQKVKFSKQCNFSANTFTRQSSLLEVELGSVGNGYTHNGGYTADALRSNSFSGAVNCATATIFTDGTAVDLMLPTARSNFPNATIYLKASKDTTYNGTDYSAGDTIITDTPSA